MKLVLYTVLAGICITFWWMAPLILSSMLAGAILMVKLRNKWRRVC